jgi:apolipoprotein N-acyltransferase
MTPTDNDRRFTRRPWRTLVGLLAALAVSYWIGRQLGLGNDELIGYLLASVSLVIAAGLVALLLFGLIRWLRR